MQRYYKTNKIKMSLKNSLVKQCLDILKTDDVKTEMKRVFAPIIELVMKELNPYIYIILVLVFLIFIMILAILIILISILRNKQIISKWIS